MVTKPNLDGSDQPLVLEQAVWTCKLLFTCLWLALEYIMEPVLPLQSWLAQKCSETFSSALSKKSLVIFSLYKASTYIHSSWENLFPGYFFHKELNFETDLYPWRKNRATHVNLRILVPQLAQIILEIFGPDSISMWIHILQMNTFYLLIILTQLRFEGFSFLK